MRSFEKQNRTNSEFFDKTYLQVKSSISKQSFRQNKPFRFLICQSFVEIDGFWRYFSKSTRKLLFEKWLHIHILTIFDHFVFILSVLVFDSSFKFFFNLGIFNPGIRDFWKLGDFYPMNFRQIPGIGDFRSPEFSAIGILWFLTLFSFWL